MTGWLLILILLVLGGVLSTLGDRLGSRVGKARLSLLGLRPRSTAVVITVLTGSLISALSLGLLLLVSRQLRVGLFELNALQDKLRNSRSELKRSREAQAGAARSLSQAQRESERARLDLTTAKAKADAPTSVVCIYNNFAGCRPPTSIISEVLRLGYGVIYVF